MSKHPTPRPPQRPTFEWIVGTICATLVLAIVFLLGFEALFGSERPPQLSAVIERLEPGSGGTLAVVTVSNEGDVAAAKVGVEATIARDGEAPQQKHIEFDYVAAGGTRSGAFVIDGKGVRMEDIDVSVQGFSDP